MSSVPESGIVSGWRHVVEKLRHREFNDLTTLPKVMLRLTELSSLDDEDHGDCYIRPDLAGVSLLDFDRFDELTEIGTRDARVALDAWSRTGDAIDLVAAERAVTPDASSAVTS